MTDYISREAAKKLVHDRAMETALNNVGFKADASDILEHISKMAQDWISDVPAADVVKVCRCAECAKAIRKEIGDGELVYWCTANFIYRSRDDYCSRGERRSDHGTEIPETV